MTNPTLPEAARAIIEAAERVVEADKARALETRLVSALARATRAGRAALAASEARAEPVAPVFAWAHRHTAKTNDGWRFCMTRPDVLDESVWEIVPLYTHPPAPQQPPVSLLWQVRKALARAAAICDAVPNRQDGHLGALVNPQPDGTHGYREIHEAEAALVAYLTTPEAAPQQPAPAERGECLLPAQRESVEDALMIVESYGPWGADLNDAHRRQIVLAEEVKRLRGLYEMAVSGRAAMRTALRRERGEQTAQRVADEERERAYNAGFVTASRMHGAEIERLRALASAPRVPQGWKLVPVQATPDMVQAGITAWVHAAPLRPTEDAGSRAWKAALAAAPQPEGGA
jgi:hypothetical protein